MLAGWPFTSAYKAPQYRIGSPSRSVLAFHWNLTLNEFVASSYDIMSADISSIKIHTSYNLTAFSFSAKELEENVRIYIPELTCTYAPDFRQKIANSWPASIDDSEAKKDWNWKPEYDLNAMSLDMITNLKIKLAK